MEAFKLVKCLRKNTNSEVYIADHVNGGTYVVKIIRFDDLSNAQITKAHQEAVLLSSMTHPSIVKYCESILQRNLLCIATEYLAGGDLRARIQERIDNNNQPFAESQIMDWFMQMCSAIQFLHERNILHRDIKPENIFLSGDLKSVKLGDFGICKVLQHSQAQAETSVGTPFYLSPEMCSGKAYGFKSDVWGLGCVLYELCSLRRPFQGATLVELVSAIRHDPVEPIPSMYSPQLASLVAMLLQRDPATRPTIADVVAGLTPPSHATAKHLSQHPSSHHRPHHPHQHHQPQAQHFQQQFQQQPHQHQYHHHHQQQYPQHQHQQQHQQAASSFAIPFDNAALNSHRSSLDSARTATGSESDRELGRVILAIRIKMQSSSAVLRVYERSDPVTLAEQFCRENGVTGTKKVQLLSNFIRRVMSEKGASPLGSSSPSLIDDSIGLDNADLSSAPSPHTTPPPERALSFPPHSSSTAAAAAAPSALSSLLPRTAPLVSRAFEQTRAARPAFSTSFAPLAAANRPPQKQQRRSNTTAIGRSASSKMASRSRKDEFLYAQSRHDTVTPPSSPPAFRSIRPVSSFRPLRRSHTDKPHRPVTSYSHSRAPTEPRQSSSNFSASYGSQAGKYRGTGDKPSASRQQPSSANAFTRSAGAQGTAQPGYMKATVSSLRTSANPRKASAPARRPPAAGSNPSAANKSNQHASRGGSALSSRLHTPRGPSAPAAAPASVSASASSSSLSSSVPVSASRAARAPSLASSLIPIPTHFDTYPYNDSGPQQHQQQSQQSQHQQHQHQQPQQPPTVPSSRHDSPRESAAADENAIAQKYQQLSQRWQFLLSQQQQKQQQAAAVGTSFTEEL